MNNEPQKDGISANMICVGNADWIRDVVIPLHDELLPGLPRHLGILLLAAGVWVMTRQKATFCVVLTTAAGEVTAYQSTDRQHIAEIIQALNHAIVYHG